MLCEPWFKMCFFFKADKPSLFGSFSYIFQCSSYPIYPCSKLRLNLVNIENHEIESNRHLEIKSEDDSWSSKENVFVFVFFFFKKNIFFSCIFKKCLLIPSADGWRIYCLESNSGEIRWVWIEWFNYFTIQDF